MQREASMRRLDASNTAVAVRLAKPSHGEVGMSMTTVITHVEERTRTELSS
jgi:hypothetical protein